MASPQQEILRSMAEELADMMGAHHPGRPAYYALMRAARAVSEASRDVGDQTAPARPRARLLPILGTVGGTDGITFRPGRQEAS